MPIIRGIKCEISTDGQVLREWGLEERSQPNAVSCYIQSQADKRFRLALTPEMPYNKELWNDRERMTRSEKNQAPPFNYLVSVYLDGRIKPERQFILFLDHDSPFFTGSHGSIYVDSRLVLSADGQVYHYCWVFGETGIGHLLTKLSVNESKQDDDGDLASIMNGSRLDQEGEKHQLGTIRVTLTRVNVTTPYSKVNRYKPHHHEHDVDDIDMTQAGGDVENTTTFHKEKHQSNIVGVDTELYVKTEPVFAEVTFMYRTEAQLRKIGFPGFPQPEVQGTTLAPPAKRRAHGRLAADIGKLRPLGLPRAMGTRTPTEPSL